MNADSQPHDPTTVVPGAEAQLRRLILTLLACALVALSGELLAIGHYEDAKQWVPLAAIGAALLAIVWHVAGPAQG